MARAFLGERVLAWLHNQEWDGGLRPASGAGAGAPAAVRAIRVVHGFNHIHQMVRGMAKGYREALGPWRQFLPLLDAKDASGRGSAAEPA